jgi:hypothetical protein
VRRTERNVRRGQLGATGAPIHRPHRGVSVAALSRLFDSFGDRDPEAHLAASPSIVPLSEDEASFDVPLVAAPVELDGGEAFPVDVEDEGEGEDEPAAEHVSPYDIPDFEKDERDLGAYEDAKRRYNRQQLSSAETAIQTSFSQKREQLQKEIKNARSFEDERRASALHTTRLYANSFPHHVDKRGIQPPSFFENLFSFGRAGRLYRAAFVSSEALEALRTAIRKREEALGALEGQLSRAIYLKEEQLKKAMETAVGINEFHERPEIKPLFLRTEKIHKERKDYEERLERGDVTDEEQRDRGMAEFKLTFTELPIMGAIIARVARFGNLTYFQLRDLEKMETLISYDPRLDGLRNAVFDVYSVAGTVAAKIKRNDNGTAFRVADHFKACWRNQDKAEELYGAHRAALREDRGLAPMTARNDGEAEIIERLVGLAQSVGESQPRTQLGDQVPAPIMNSPTVRP